MKNKVFFPQDLLDLLLNTEQVDIDEDKLVLKESGLEYKLIEAVRIQQEITTGEDPYDVCGRVKTREYLESELGAELLGGSMLVEEWGYDVIQGFSALPTADGNELETLKALHSILD